MKRAFWTICILMVSVLASAQTQRGVAYRYNGKNPRTPLGNVTISYDADKRTTISAENGEFTLTMIGKKMGDHIGHVTVRKREMMVFNQQAVDEWSIRKDPLMLILCNADEFEKQKENLINIGKREAKKKYDLQKAELEAKLKASQIKETEYEAALDKAYENLERLQKNIGEYAELFARIDLSKVTAEEQRILDLVNEGRVEEALEAYDKLELIDKFNSEATTYQTLDNAVQQIEKEKELRNKNIDELYEAVLRHVSTLILAEKEQDAEQKLHSMLEKLTPLFDSYPEKFRPKKAKVQALLGDIASSQSERTEYLLASVKEYTILYSQNPNIYQAALSKAQLSLGTHYIIYYNAYTKAEEFLLSALENYTALFKQSPDKYRVSLALTKYELGEFYHEVNRYLQAEQLYLDALDMLEIIAKQGTYPYFLSASINEKLGNLYLNELSLLTKAEKAYLQELECFRQLALQDMEEYGKKLNDTQLTMLAFYVNRIKNQAKTEEFIQKENLFYLERIDSLSLLFQQDSEKHGDELALLLENFISVLINILAITDNNIDKIEKNYQIILENYDQLYQHNPVKFGANYAEGQDRIGRFYLNYSNDTIKAENYFLMTLETYSKLNQIDPIKYGALLAKEEGRIGNFYKGHKNDSTKAELFFHIAEENYTKTLDILTAKYQQDFLKYGEDLAHVQNSLASFYRFTLEDSVNAEKYYLKELGTYTQLSQRNQEKYGAVLARKQELMGNFYDYIYGEDLDYLFHKTIDDSAKKKAEEYYLKAEKEYVQLSTLDFIKYGYLLAEIQNMLAQFYKTRMNDLSKAEEYLFKSEKTFIRLSSLDLIKYGTFLVLSQKSIVGFYEYDMKDKEKEEEYYLKALATANRIFELAPNIYRSELAFLQNEIRLFYANDNSKLEQYDAMLEVALANYEVLYKEDQKDYYKENVVNLRNRKGWRCLQTGKTDEALSLFESAYQLDSEASIRFLSSGYNAKAYEYAKVGDYTHAIKTIDMAISLKPEEANFYDSKGEILLMKGDEKNAIKMWQKVLELDPNFLSKHDRTTELYRLLKERGLVE